MLILQSITDPVYTKPAKPSFFERFIRDPRDLPFVYLSIRITLVLGITALLLYMPFVDGWLWGITATVYLVFNNAVFKGPFGLMLHCTSHRAFFRKEYGFMNHYLPWVLGPLFGQTPETYYSHHIGMHHAENNMPEDESSTMKYQRDSFRGFSMYLGSFFFAGVYHLCTYFYRKNRKRLLYRSVRGELLFIAMCVGLSFVNWPATLVVFIIPFVISRIIMMMGNWAQHAFIDASDPGNHYKNSITCINTKYNHKCWNDGYHISHHVKPNMHWTEHPVYFRQTLQEYIDNEGIVFDGIHFLHVFLWLVTRRYDKLARHYVNIGDRFSSDEEVIAFLKERTKKIPESELELGVIRA
ncbi:fatty acid desaturase family protein [Chitinophaga rhizosphaerae]|uniref:fatty acid desaturase family protein n=1 Tax=Chitinophaga rhizosphaerae TaxID=1864947 RepID=UPI000F802042|nr:fatty acid desaturase [Chitinophaga rhizosphaerae]